MPRFDHTFSPLPSSEPSFRVTLGQTSTANPLESTSRIWQGPSGRSIRLSETSGVDFYIALGSSLVAAVSTASMQVLGAVAEVFQVHPSHTYVAIVTTSTQVSDVNITLGYGR